MGKSPSEGTLNSSSAHSIDVFRKSHFLEFLRTRGVAPEFETFAAIGHRALARQISCMAQGAPTRRFSRPPLA
jgi:hypothetical protein